MNRSSIDGRVAALLVAFLFVSRGEVLAGAAQEQQPGADARGNSEHLGQPKKPEDVQNLVGTVRALSAPGTKAQKKSVRDIAARSLGNPDPASKEALTPVYLRLLDDSDETIKGAAARACAKLHATEAAPKILEVLSKAPREKYSATNPQWMTPDHMEFVDSSAEALVELGHDAAIDEILSRDELMVNSSFSGPLVARYGAKALPKVLELARKKDQRRNGALSAIVALRDETAAPDLLRLTNDDDKEIARSAIHALADMPMKSVANIVQARELFKQKLSSADRFIRGYAYSGLIRVDPSGGLPTAMESLRKDPAVRLDILYALIRNPLKAVVPYLKDYIAEDEKWEPNDTTGRAVAAQAIFKATGERVPYKGVERELSLYEKGLRPDPYDPYGKDGAHMKPARIEK
ncbi:MAG TPA: hypothetical protein VN915_17355 [Elusimicrobiota bacterium]|nr:hypothetical protein [Elusimicrobiota bacterium]